MTLSTLGPGLYDTMKEFILFVSVKTTYTVGDENGQRAVRVELGKSRAKTQLRKLACVAASFPMHGDRGFGFGLSVIDLCTGCVQWSLCVMLSSVGPLRLTSVGDGNGCCTAYRGGLPA